MAMETLARDPSERISLAILGAYDLKRHHLQEGIKETLKAQALGYDGLDSLKTLVAVMIDLGRFEEAEKSGDGSDGLPSERRESRSVPGHDPRPAKTAGGRRRASEKGAGTGPREPPHALLSFSESYGNRIDWMRRSPAPGKRSNRIRSAVTPGLPSEVCEEIRKNGHAALEAYQKATEAESGNYVCWRYLALSAPDYAKASDAAKKSGIAQSRR